jgi:ATP-dependent phosphofructokinase / diphosphate-dependent phosphofructokinase
MPRTRDEFYKGHDKARKPTLRLGILTGGGDCAGLNAVIRGVVKRANDYGYEVIGIRRGWAGLLAPDTFPLKYDAVADIISEGGTILQTSRTNIFGRSDGPEVALKNAKKLGLDCLIAIGGDDTLGVAYKLSKLGIPVVGIPKTMDNDLSGTDYTFGFQSAVDVSTEAIDRIRTTGESHERVMVVEVMGREAGWVAAYAGTASGAHVILVPEEKFDLEEVLKTIRARMRSGKKFSLVVVAEGALPLSQEKETTSHAGTDEFGHARLGGIGKWLAEQIQEKTGAETRETVLGHIVRGGSPNAFDRVLSTRLGVAAVDLVKEGKFGRMVGLKGTEIVDLDIRKALTHKLVDMDLVRVGRIFT